MKRAVVLGAVGLSLLAAAPAFAFCRTTTCDANDPKANCETDANKCVTTGFPLAWRSSCVTIGVQEMGDPRDGFSADDIGQVVEQAFGTWMAADCGGGKTPSIHVDMLGPIECGTSEYNGDAANANVVIFRSGKWPYPGAENAIGLTTTRFDNDSGDLWDADIELNGQDTHFSVGDPITGYDLLSVLTHEAGHFLGLSHWYDDTATMRPIYSPANDGTTFRSLEPDDIKGVCSIYAPGRKAQTNSCENRHGFSTQCGADQPVVHESKGCSLNTRTGVPGATSQSGAGLLAWLAAACGARLARRRRIV